MSKLKHIEAKVLLQDGSRVALTMLAASRRAADAVIEQLYPEALYASVLVKSAGGQA